MTQYGNGYQDALADVKRRWDQDGADAALTWITDNLSPIRIIPGGSLVTNIKTGKRYRTEGDSYIGVNGRHATYVRSLDGKGAGHYMRVENLRVVTE